MILVDTSVFIDFLKNKKNEGTEKLESIIELKIPFGISSHIYQELLQGTASTKDFDSLKRYLDLLNFYHPLDPKKSYEEAAKIYFTCRRKGITLRSTLDCLIAQIAREHHLKLLHHDADFNKIKHVVTELTFF